VGDETVSTAIHGDDEMFNYVLTRFGNREQALCYFLQTGKEILNAVTQVVNWRRGGFDNVSAFLDFAGGYGRLTRFLVNRLPAARVWVSDISEGAVRFQGEQFRVHGVVSDLEPSKLKFDRRFDFVLVMSLFTHLPERTFTRWLRTLYKLTNEDGVLIFTVHDQSLNPHLEMPESGFWFEEEIEIDTLSKQD
jgi:SAM-dependent methyltransferase